MIRMVKGDILESDAPVIVIPVNCKGVMGKGLALQAKKRYPRVYESYKSYCQGACPDAPEGMQPGSVLAIQHVPNRFLACLSTKDDWRNPSKMEWIESGLQDLVKCMNVFKFTKVAIPKIGCGLGGLDWCDVKEKVLQTFGDTAIDVDVYEGIN